MTDRGAACPPQLLAKTEAILKSQICKITASVFVRVSLSSIFHPPSSPQKIGVATN
jgi:hypothetical protein